MVRLESGHMALDLKEVPIRKALELLFENAGVSFTAKAFSQWPEPIGLAAAGDSALVEQFGDIAQTTSYDSYAFLPEQGAFTLCEHFKTKSLEGFGCAEMLAAIGAATAVSLSPLE